MTSTVLSIYRDKAPLSEEELRRPNDAVQCLADDLTASGGICWFRRRPQPLYFHRRSRGRRQDRHYRRTFRRDEGAPRRFWIIDAAEPRRRS